MKNETNKPTKKKIALYYLALAACLVIIASITVGVVFAVRNANRVSLDKNGGGTVQTPNDDNKGNNDDDDNKGGNDDDNKNDPVNTTTTFISPVTNVDLSQAHVFGYDKTLDRYRLHGGIDLQAAAGTEVYAAVDGTVTEVSVSDPLFGAVVTIEHANGVKTVYKFIDPNENLTAGTKVTRGQTIGAVAAATGVENADGDHLHFEVYKNGVMQDPADYLDAISK